MTRAPLAPLACLLASAPALAGQEAPGGGARIAVDDGGHQALAIAEDGTSGPARAATPTSAFGGWSALGPWGGDVSDVGYSPTNPQVALACVAPKGGSGGTLYRSGDGGQTWTQSPAFAGLSTYDVEFAADGTAWVGSLDGPWKSSDAGLTWTQHGLSIGANDQVLEVTLDPSNPLSIWVGIGGALSSQPVNVMHSTDGGLSWSDATPPQASTMSCTGIAIDPGDPSRVACAFRSSFCCGAVYTSSDGGQTWADKSSGLPTSSQFNGILHDGTRLLLWGGHLFGSQNVGVFGSTDHGTTWTPLHDATWPSLAINDVVVDPASAAVLYAASSGAGLFRSLDGGATWALGLAGTGPLTVQAVDVHPGGGAPVLIGCSSAAVLQSLDGTTFAPSANGIGALRAESVAASPLDPEELAVAFQGLNDGGVFTSTDGGASWKLEDLPGTRFNTVGFAPDGALHAISDGPSTIAPEGLYRRVGGTWVPLGPDQGSAFESELFALAFSQNDPNLIVMGGSDFGVAGHEPTVWLSQDDGATWTKTHEGASTHEDVLEIVILDDGTDQRMVAAHVDFGSDQNGGALRSTDGGQSWSPANSGLPSPVQCRSLARSIVDANTVWLSNDGFAPQGLFRSTDGGATWFPTGHAGGVRRIRHDPLRPDRLYAATWGAPLVQVSDDGGATFTAVDTGLAQAGSGLNLGLGAGACNQLLLSTTAGVWADTASCQLEASPTEISLASGGTQNLDLHAGVDHAGEVFVLLGSTSGTEPGLTFGGVTIPLNPDPYFTMTVGLPPHLIPGPGQLDSSGGGSAQVVVPTGLSPALAGAVLHHAFVSVVPVWVPALASNPVPLTLKP